MDGSLSIPNVRLANLVPGVSAVSADDKGVNETYIGNITLSQSEECRAYIKVLPAKQLVNELICSTLGRAIGLPIPEGFIVHAYSGDIPQSALLASHKGDVLLFACADVGRPSLKRRLSETGGQFLQQLFSTWTTWDDAAIFDEWIANIDRHPGNLLIEGANKVWLIDHSHSFTGPNWNINNLVSDASVINQIADLIFPTLPLPNRIKIKEKAERLARVYRLINADAAFSSCYVDRIIGSEDFSALKNFVSDRINQVNNLVSHRLGILTLGI